MPTVKGSTVADASVEIRLQSSALSPSSIDDRLYTVVADANGDWSSDLVANGELDPPHTVYEVTEDAGGTPTTSVIRVPDGIGTFDVANLVVDYSATLTAKDAAVVDVTYGAEEAGVIDNNRTRVEEIETRLKAVGIL